MSNFYGNSPATFPNSVAFLCQKQQLDQIFGVELLCDNCRSVCTADVESLIAKCKPRPWNFYVNRNGEVAGKLIFRNQSDAVDAVVFLWERRLEGVHFLTPVTDFGTEDVNERLGILFRLHVQNILAGEVMQGLQKKMEDLSVEIERISALLKRPKQFGLFSELQAKKSGLMSEVEMIAKRIEEFGCAMNCVLDYLEGKEFEDNSGEGFRVLKFEEGFNWSRIHCLVMRECRRLKDGLPLYAYRREILLELHSQQVTVLIGETGSGKSTQLVQFLADSGVAGKSSILCTQPRRLAAISLAKRVGEESNGCYQNNPVVCYPTYSSSQVFDSELIYMTDHCLLQHFMKDKTLSGVSCIILDEVHERSLNTDLLLALVKDLLCQRFDFRLIIMSATVDASKLSEYLFDCGTFHVVGRSFPVEIKYITGAYGGLSGPSPGFADFAPYVADVVKMAMEIHKSEEEGAILAFLTSQMEVECACERFQSPSAIVFALHGKLSHEEQCRVFQNYPGKRKVIFTTNLAETSLTIPGVKYVVDSGMVKESRFEQTSGMNVLRVSKISQSSANQRAGRAGRTEPGKCYRLYSECDYKSMISYQEPEIHKVHLGIAVLRILALGINNVLKFDFVDAPDTKAVDMAIRNLVQLGAVTLKNGVFELTYEGRYLVKLGIEPRLGKIILESFRYHLCKEGVVLAAVMANANSMFCRVGTSEDKLKSDSLKVRFCHRGGDLFTLLSVYREWDSVPRENRNQWCWENSINAKTMRRCRETVLDLENCLKNELGVVIPNDWLWNPHFVTEHDKNIKKIIFSSLADNVARHSGYDRLGYEVVLSGEHIQLHPSCSLQIYSQKPTWVVFAELLSISYQYLVCVTAIDYDIISAHTPCSFDVSDVERRKLQVRVITGFGSTVLRRFCGKSNRSLLCLLSRIQTKFMDKRIGVEINVDKNEIQIYASLEDMEKVFSLVNDALEYEIRWCKNECLEKSLYRGGHPGATPPVALFGAGAEIKHLELEQRYLTVDVFHSNANSLDDKDVLTFFEKSVSGLSGVHKFSSSIGQDGEYTEKWGRVTFLTPEAARKAVELNGVELCGSMLKLSPAQFPPKSDRKWSSFPALNAKVFWPRRYSKGCAVVKCAQNDVEFIVSDCYNLLIGGRFVRCEPGIKDMHSVVIRGLDREISEPEILEALKMATDRKILALFLLRGDAVDNPPFGACQEAILKEIAPFMPNHGPLINYCRVQVFPPEPKDSFMKALITFDGGRHLEAAQALQHIQGKVIAGCLSWQKIQCQQVFYSFVSCPGPVYVVIKRQLDALLKSFKHQPGVYCSLDRNENGSYRVKISANATMKVAELRKPLEQLMNGKTVDHASFTPTVSQLLFSRDGIMLMKSLQQEMGTYILFDKQNPRVRIFGLEDRVALTEQKLVQSLIALHDNKKTEIRLRSGELPHDLMKRVVEKFGPDLHGLEEKFPNAEFSLNVRHHIIYFSGNKELRQKVEAFIYEFARSFGDNQLAKQPENEAITCPICLCEVEDCYRLEACAHEFCRSCLVDQLESAITSRDGFPISCTHEGCGTHIWLTDLKALLSSEKIEELFWASLGAFVVSSGGLYRFCPSPDCPSVYQVAEAGTAGKPFVCGACYAETCTSCHLEYHPYVTCERYKEFKEDPDASLKEWCRGKEHVKCCPVCRHIIEKMDGCNHIECRCGMHICWVCLECFGSSDDCYGHLRSVHLAII